MKPISLSILESIPTPQAAEGSPVRSLSDRQVPDARGQNDQSPVQPLARAKPVSRKRVDENEQPTINNEKEKAPTDRMTFGEFLQAQKNPDEVVPVPVSVPIPVTVQVTEPVTAPINPNEKPNVEFATPQHVVLTQTKRPVLQNIIASAQAKPEQTISPVQLPGVPDTSTLDVDPQPPVQSTSRPSTSEATPTEMKLLAVAEINPQTSETPPLLESIEPFATDPVPTPQPVVKQPAAEIPLTANPIKSSQMPVGPLEVNQELPPEISKPVLDNRPIDLGLPEGTEPAPQLQLKPVSPVVFDAPTKLTAYTYRPELLPVKTGEPEVTVAPRDNEAPNARISSILKKLIQENPTDSLLPVVSTEMPTVASGPPTNTPITIDTKLPQATHVIDSESIRLNPRVDSLVASQVVAQISEHWSMEDMKIGQSSSREITIQIKPQELGAIKILVETTDGRLQARIEASELITSEMLIKEKGQLLSALKDRGLDVPDLDISYRDPESQNSHRQDQQEPGERFDFRNERQRYRNQTPFDSQEPEAVQPPSTKRFVINVIA